MTGGVAGVVLAAGEGRRLRPLTLERPKALCPVGNEPLVDRAVHAVRQAVHSVAVNVHHGRAAMVEHLEGLTLGPVGTDDDAEPSDAGDREASSVHVSIEEREALGTAGALGNLRSWLAGRAALVVNADAWAQPDLTAFVAGWDHERIRILTVGAEPFGPASRIVASLLPWSEIKHLEPVPCGLYERSWAPALHAGALETVAYDGPFVDCGTPAAYLRANLLAVVAHERAITAPAATIDADASVIDSVVGDHAHVSGAVTASVVWEGATVAAGEQLHHAIRTSGGRTVLVR